MAQDDDDKGVNAIDVAGGASAGIVGGYAGMAAYGAAANRNVAGKDEEEISSGVKKLKDKLDDKPVEGKAPIPGVETKYQNFLDETLFAEMKDGKYPATALDDAERALLDTHFTSKEHFRKHVRYDEAIDT